MGRRAAIALHLALFAVGAALYVLFVIPRWWVLTGDIPTSLAAAGRIAAGLPIALAALPVVLNLKRALKPESNTPELALRLRAWSLLLHVLAGALIIAAAVAEIWLGMGAAGAWLFGVYGAGAAVAVLGLLAFYLAFVAERPPKPPKPPKPPRPAKTKRERRRRRGTDDAENDADAEADADADADADAGESPETDETGADDSEESPTPVTAEADGSTESAESGDSESEPVDAEPVTTSGLANKRPTGKTRHRLRR